MGILNDPIPSSPLTNIRRIVWQTVRRITNEILGVKGSRVQHWRNRIVRETGDKKKRSGARNMFHMM